MRIIQLSDIHLSNSNLDDLRNFYITALIDDLKKFHESKAIDIILITGDLVDKGGSSLGIDCYSIFKQEFINPILEALNLKSEQILFVPGNHDIEKVFIDEENEFYLVNKLDKELANLKIKEQEHNFTSATKRIEKFKKFEKEFHKDNENYEFSFNQSLTTNKQDDLTVGFALINDSWRCSPTLKQENHFIGFNQLHLSGKFLESKNCTINIAVFHHPLEKFNSTEQEEIDNILKAKKFDIAFFGHNHNHKYESIVSPNGSLLAIHGRAAFNDSNEKISRFQPGYNILDLDVKNKTYVIYARKFIKNGFRFDKDVESLINGVIEGTLTKPSYISLNDSQPNLDNKDLPNGYSADVNRIVKLLIGKSLYPNPFTFVRELIQNSVDACNRTKEKYSYSDPKIIVRINTEENYFEIIDEGDGMSKKVLNEHFAIVGKSISQEFNSSVNQVNLISQFGIGFISTFIVAQKIYIRTKSEEDDLICFEIKDVFKGFTYNNIPEWENFQPKNTGTSIKVYLKKEFNAIPLLSFAKQYCRHIKDLTFYLNDSLHNHNESWNTEEGDFSFQLKNTKYEFRLVISQNPRSIIATNSGFLINTNAPQIIPYRFPFIIGGEVIFEPRSIDFDLSRTNIIETEKASEFKKEISVSLRSLFRQVIESDNVPVQLKILTLNYIQFYLLFYDKDLNKFTDTYSDFYSKKELMTLCMELMEFNFKAKRNNLYDILKDLKTNRNPVIYIDTSGISDDLNKIVSSYLYGKGNLVVQPEIITVQFREGPIQFSIAQLLEIIASENGFLCVNIANISQNKMVELRVENSELHEKIANSIGRIKNVIKKNIEFANFGTTTKAVIHFNDEYFINHDHHYLQNLINNIENYNEETLGIYFLGLLGLNLNLATN